MRVLVIYDGIEPKPYAAVVLNDDEEFDQLLQQRAVDQGFRFETVRAHELDLVEDTVESELE